MPLSPGSHNWAWRSARGGSEAASSRLRTAPLRRCTESFSATRIVTSHQWNTYFQETHPQELFRECTAYCEVVSSAKQLPYALNIALRTALEQKDVAVLIIPGDMLLESVDRP